MKYWIVKVGEKYSRIGAAGFIPEGHDAIWECPVEAEHIKDIEIVDDKPVFSAAKQAARLAAEAQAAIDAAAAKQVEDTARVQIKQRVAAYVTQLNNANIDGIASLADAKTILKGLRLILVNLVDDIGKIANRTI